MASLAAVGLGNVEAHATERPTQLTAEITVVPSHDLDNWTNELDYADDIIEQLDAERVVHAHPRRNFRDTE